MRALFETRALFIIGWLWVLLTGLILQLWVIPSTTWHAGHGLLAGGDWVLFQEQALRLTERIKGEGWDAWELRFEGQEPASFAAAVYALTGITEPWVLLPIHGLLYAISIWAAISTAKQIGVHERLLLVISIPFLFPSSTLIFGQLHKDILSLPGVLLIIWSWTSTQACKEITRRELLEVAVATAAGILLIWWARPYLAQLLLATTLAISLIAIIRASSKKKWIQILGPATIAISITGSYFVAHKLTTETTETTEKCTTWKPELDIPGIANPIASLFCFRHYFIKYYTEKAANIDHEIPLTNYREAIWYIPRALQIGVFSPFPTHWISEASSPGGAIKRIISGVEMIYIYFILIGMIWAFKGHTNPWITYPIIIIGLVGILLYVYTSPNVGSIYRYRLPFMITLLIVATLGWSNRYIASHTKLRLQCKH